MVAKLDTYRLHVITFIGERWPAKREVGSGVGGGGLREMGGGGGGAGGQGCN